ncbi:hypothetical protein F511_42781 [Dorcoceras hygrometricum]|uniref:Uncharacterized protein n=1 Tax=Dorcoceras hygrometricum TaxID=472368 RepID=A0A2Z7ARM1_9LAMI|nr:hypothetical protein F511_42781 [Dorcoceras hygrometricum]
MRRRFGVKRFDQQLGCSAVGLVTSRWCDCLRLSDGFGSGPTGPGPTDEHSVHPHHRYFIVTPITDQIGPINSVSKTEHYNLRNHFSEPQCKMTVSPLNSGIQLAVGPKPLRLRNHNFGLAHRIMYGPFNPYIPIRPTTIGKSRVSIDPIAMHTSWRSNSDIASVTRTNQYNQDLELIHSTNGNHLEILNEGTSIDHQILAGFTTEEAEADTVADQGLKRVNRIFGGLNEGIWPKTEELTMVILARWTVSEEIA